MALVPTFAVIEQVMDPESLDVEPATRDRIAGARQRMIEALMISREAGVRIGLGSDLLGSGQHRRGEELRLRAELESPMQALVSATSVNADILGIGDTVGMLRVGMAADMVAWARNPLDDARVFAEPDMAAFVVKAGRIMKGDTQ